MDVLQVLMEMNPLLDHIHKRATFYADADALVQAHEEGRVGIFVAAFTVPTIFYLSRREYERTMVASQARVQAFNAVQSILSSFQICNIKYSMLQEAWRMGGEDYEDNLQLVCARAYKLDAIVT